MRFSTENVRSLYSSDSDSIKRTIIYKLYLVRVQEVKWEGSGTETAGE
jgi:hypothetical protein